LILIFLFLKTLLSRNYFFWLKNIWSSLRSIHLNTRLFVFEVVFMVVV
jgi:hypothetical protein